MSDDWDERPVSLEKVIDLLRNGDIWIEKFHSNGFLYIVGAFKEVNYADNQDLLNQAINSPGVRMEQWREGWGADIRSTDKVRYII